MHIALILNLNISFLGLMGLHSPSKHHLWGSHCKALIFSWLVRRFNQTTGYMIQRKNVVKKNTISVGREQLVFINFMKKVVFFGWKLKSRREEKIYGAVHKLTQVLYRKAIIAVAARVPIIKGLLVFLCKPLFSGQVFTRKLALS